MVLWRLKLTGILQVTIVKAALLWKLIKDIRQYDSSDTGHSDNLNIVAEHQEPEEVLSQLDNTSNSPVYGEYKCC